MHTAVLVFLLFSLSMFPDFSRLGWSQKKNLSCSGIFRCWMPMPLPNQQRYSTENNSKLW